MKFYLHNNLDKFQLKTATAQLTTHYDTMACTNPMRVWCRVHMSPQVSLKVRSELY